MSGLPHKWPGLPSDGNAECIAWKCAACGEWVSEYGDRSGCSVDWNRPTLAQAWQEFRDAAADLAGALGRVLASVGPRR